MNKEKSMMHPSITNPTNEMTMSSPTFMTNPSNFYPNPSSNSNKTYSYSDLVSPSSLHYMDLLRTWNYHQFLTSSSSAASPSTVPFKSEPTSDNTSGDYHPRNGSFHQYSPRLLPKSPSSSSFGQQTDDSYILGKFHHDTLVNLETNETKNIQQLTTSDFLTSAKQNQQYSRLN